MYILDVYYSLCITWIMHQQLCGYKVEEKLYVGVCEQKRLNTTGLFHQEFVLKIFLHIHAFRTMFVWAYVRSM
jgi:hypothetical protein